MVSTTRQVTPEVVSACHRWHEVDGTDISFNHHGWVMDDKHFLSVDDMGISICEYSRKGSIIEIPEDAKVIATIDLHLQSNPEVAFDLREFSGMSFADFMYRLIEIGKEA